MSLADQERTFEVTEPASDLFVDEGEDCCWAWAGNHTASQAVSFARHEHGIEGPIHVRLRSCRIEFQPGETSDSDPWLMPDDAGPYEFWQVTGEGHHEYPT